MDKDIGMYIFFGYNLPVDEGMRCLAGAGFGAVSLWWGDEFDYGLPLKRQPDFARMLGLEIDYAHLPYMNANGLWTDNLFGEDCESLHLGWVKGCAEHGIPRAVMHLTQGSDVPPLSDIGLTRLRRIADFGMNCGVRVAFENLDHPEYLEAAMNIENLQSAAFCYDCGHENVYTKDIPLLEKYGHRLDVLHLSDNDGTFDQHRLPGQGNIDFGKLARNLINLRYGGRIMLEVFSDSEIPLEAYLDRALSFGKSFRDEIKAGMNTAYPPYVNLLHIES